MPSKLQIWPPFPEFDQFRRSLDDMIRSNLSMFDRFLGRTPGEAMREMMGPALESFVENDKVVIRADLPGIDPKDVDVTVSGDTLTIRCKREHRQEGEGRDYLHREISYGVFERSVKLPARVDADQIKAWYENGVLELTAPVPKELSPRKVPVMARGEKRKDG
jgi:HSP20 family protein